jgi:hypothetical protein
MRSSGIPVVTGNAAAGTSRRVGISASPHFSLDEATCTNRQNLRDQSKLLCAIPQ